MPGTAGECQHSVRGGIVSRACLKRVVAVLVGGELSTVVVVWLVGVLLVVQPVGVGVPEINVGADNRVSSLGIVDVPIHKHGGVIGKVLLHDIGAIGIPGSVLAEEGAEDGGEGCSLDHTLRHLDQCLLGDLVHQGLKPNNVGDQDALVAVLVRHLAGPVERVYAEKPLGAQQLDVTSKGVEVLDHGGEDFAGALGGLGAHGVNDMVGEGVGEGFFEVLDRLLVSSRKLYGSRELYGSCCGGGGGGGGRHAWD